MQASIARSIEELETLANPLRREFQPSPLKRRRKASTRRVEKSAAARWDARYRGRPRFAPVYPTEWVVRTLAGGNYPKLKLDKSQYVGRSILDLSCGDGRNLRLLQDLGFSVHATEISDAIVRSLRRKRRAMGWKVEFRRGVNQAIPYEDHFFDYLLACSSCYYLDHSSSAERNLQEIARVLKPGGYFIANFPDPRNAVLSHARRLGDGSMLITQDPFELRNGARWIVPRNKSELRELLRPHFGGVSVGHLAENYYGLQVSGFIIVCRKK